MNKRDFDGENPSGRKDYPIVLSLSEGGNIRFQLNVDGTSSEPTEARLVCETEGIEYGFRGRLSDDGGLEIHVPSMEGRLQAGTYRSRLEVMVEGTRFVPMTMEIVFKEPVRVTVTERKALAPSPGPISLRAAYVKRKEGRMNDHSKG